MLKIWINLVFIPPNTSSRLQPMDQGVIHSLKSRYRQVLLLRMVDFIDSGGEKFTINLLDAINIIHMAWQKVSKETTLNCFTDVGFLEVEAHFDPDDDLPLVEWMKKIQQEDDLRDNIRPNLPYSENDFNEFVHIDDQVVTVEYLDNDAIVAGISSAVDTDDDEEKENKDEESVGTTYKNKKVV
ncbi:unnamed protein product [Acanthoscelides obtectus]|uniref:DDE-1 domain-containing protein n=1 Tax=Acanthoscelides obtectus TaxID=200917 RepID=A0A9P0NXJ6_ACAOB|nr:unnamed protein product [Acanthoscelides obtectus]CAK1638111.1 Tigger transposable element-derived protein 4 [Acanthoscelides obtectus]